MFKHFGYLTMQIFFFSIQLFRKMNFKPIFFLIQIGHDKSSNLQPLWTQSFISWNAYYPKEYFDTSINYAFQNNIRVYGRFDFDFVIIALIIPETIIYQLKVNVYSKISITLNLQKKF